MVVESLHVSTIGSFGVGILLRVDPHPYMPKIQQILSDVDVVLDY